MDGERCGGAEDVSPGGANGIVRLHGLKQPPCNTTMMGVVTGALDYYGISRTPGEAFVLSGHAFLMNVHEELCPSGPYLWRYDRFFELLTNLGLAMQNAGALTPTADPARRAALEERLRGAIDAGVVCSLLNMEHQLLLGYDGDGFTLAQPWGADCSMTPARLSFGSWREFRDGPPVTFFTHTTCPPRPESAVSDALDFALDLWRHPERYTEAPYAVGAGAYDTWLDALDGGRRGGGQLVERAGLGGMPGARCRLPPGPSGGRCVSGNRKLHIRDRRKLRSRGPVVCPTPPWWRSHMDGAGRCTNGARGCC